VLGFTWALLSPPGQSPDEPAHVAYVQVLGERFDLPDPDVAVADLREKAFSTEQKLARDRAHEQWQYAEPAVKSEWDPSAERRWKAEDARLHRRDRRDGGGPNSAAGNPPLYYAYEALAYRAAAGTYFDRLFTMRMWSVLLLGVGVVATWLLVGELIGGDRLAQLVAGAVVGLQPMATFISASVNPDSGLLALWALAFWLGVRLLTGRVRTREVVALVTVTIAALLTKASSLALLPAVAFVFAVVVRRRLAGRWTAARVLGLVAGAAVVLAAATIGASGRVEGVFALHLNDLRGFASYLWQAYLPNLPWQNALPGLAAFAGYDVWIRSGWAAFGWLEVQFPGPVYALLAVISVGIVAAAVVAVRRGRFTLDRAVLGFFALAAFTLVAALHWADFRQLVTDQGSFLQGRYLLPLLPLGAVATAAALSNLRPGRRGTAAAIVLGGLFALQLLSLGLIAVRFYV
jgi:4-amino-4-deoxy-L-arabinose transferase-like glycosyltransferase